MAMSPCASESEQGSILLPVILLLLLLATAATAMTLQARTSLREAATRRDRLVLAATADAAVRATALALAGAAAAKASPPFGLNGTPQGCRLAHGRQLVLVVQDEGGLVDLNKATPDLVQEILRRAGLAAAEVSSLAGTIVAHRADAARSQALSAKRPRQPQTPPPEVHDFVLADEIGDLPGVDVARFDRLRPLFTTSNRSAGVDPVVAAPSIRAMIPPKELASPTFEAMVTPSNHTDFTITASIATASGQSFARRALFRLDPGAGGLGLFTAWDEVPTASVPAPMTESAFCQHLATALAEP